MEVLTCYSLGQYFEAAFASYGTSPETKANYSLTAGEKLVTPDGREETESKWWSLEAVYFCRLAHHLI